MFRPLLAVLVEFNRKISVCYLAVEVSDMKYYFHRILRSVLGLCALPGEGFGLIHPRNDWDNTIAPASQPPGYSHISHLGSDNQLKLLNRLTQSDGSGWLHSLQCPML